MNKVIKIVFSLLFCTLLFGACSNYNKIYKSENVEKKYEAAIKYYDNKDYYRAGELLDQVIPVLKGRIEAEKAQFMYAYTQYYQRSYPISAFQFKSFSETYGRSPMVEEATFMYAKSLYMDSPEFNLDQTNTQTSIVAIQDFLNRYPESRYKEEASKMYDELAFKLEQKAFESAKLYSQMRFYTAAVVAFTTFEQQYPSSNFNEEAAYLKILAQFNLATESVESKQRERYFDTIGFYQAFLDKYPKSRFLKSAEALYDKSTKQLERLKGPSTAKVE